MTTRLRLMNTTQLAKYLPILDWGRTYDRSTLTNDLVAALIVTIMLIPQSLAYALLAGLPPEIGLYASMLPIILYAIFGTSRALAVGPVAVVSLLTVAAVSKIAVPGTSEYIAAAITLAFLSGLILLALGVFRLGFLANFLSHPVIAGFITATGIIIAANQLKNILGIDANGHTLPDLIRSLAHNLSQVNWVTAEIGVLAMGFLFWVRKGLLPLLVGLGLAPRIAGIVAKAGPVAAIVVTTLIVWFFDLAERGVQVVGDVPKGLPPLTMPSFSIDIWSNLIGAAAFIGPLQNIQAASLHSFGDEQIRQHSFAHTRHGRAERLPGIANFHSCLCPFWQRRAGRGDRQGRCSGGGLIHRFPAGLSNRRAYWPLATVCPAASETCVESAVRYRICGAATRGCLRRRFRTRDAA